MSAPALTIALTGNPNSGKTTIFNALTGGRQHVGNYPGVTVEKIEGRTTHDGRTLRIVDLPGTYSLTPYSVEEVVARDFLFDERPDVVVDILDCANLERNLYLATQLLELGVPLVLAFNMSDVAAARGYRIDVERLSGLLGVPIVETVGHKGEGLGELLDAAVAASRAREQAVAAQRRPNYGTEIEPHVVQMTERVAGALGGARYCRWLAVKLIEGDRVTRRRIRRLCPDGADELIAEGRRLGEHIEGVGGDSPEILFADRRYGFISGACTETVTQTVERRHEISDRIDAVLAHRWVGLPIFVALMYLVFYVTFAVGQVPMHWLEQGFAALGEAIARLWPRGSESLLKSLLIDGVIAGVGGVITFLPNVMLLFLAIAFLEDTGYMARAAFVMDSLMHRIGLHGKSFIPMLIGFGCSVPAILATRTLESRRDRLTTMMIIPLMSCGARLPIYALIIPAFFPAAWQAPMLWAIYFIGIALAVVAAKLLRMTVLKGETTPFVMELPPYRMPPAKGLLTHMWERSWMYVRKAGTIILGVSIILWAATTFPRKTQYDKDYAAAETRAVEQYLAEAKGLNRDVGLPAESDLLVSALRGELQMREGQAEHWPGEGGYEQASERKEARMAELASREGGGALKRFLAARDALAAGQQELERAGGDGDTSREYLVAERRYRTVVEQLRARDPGALAAAEAYLDRIRPELRTALSRLAAERRAEELTYSVIGRVGRGLAPLLRPMGFDWRIGTALVGAVAAKEVFVAQLGIVFSVGEEAGSTDTLRRQLRDAYSPLVGFCVMLFTLIATPCAATCLVTWREAKGLRWMALQFGGLTAIAYVLTLAVYQIGRLFG